MASSVLARSATSWPVAGWRARPQPRRARGAHRPCRYRPAGRPATTALRLPRLLVSCPSEVGNNDCVARSFEGVVRFSRSVLLAEDALGQTFRGSLDLGEFSLTMPRLPENTDTDHVSLITPCADNERLAQPMGNASWGYVGFAKNPPAPRLLASWVDMVVVNITLNSRDTAEFYKLADDFGNAFDIWYSIAVQWIELWTDQVLVPDENRRIFTQGSVWDLSADPPRLTGWGTRLGPVFLQFSDVAARRYVLQSAFSKASRPERPPIEWLIHLRARRWNDDRLAVIEAASAAEIVLARALYTRLHGFPEAARNRIARNANGLSGLVQLLEAMDGTTGKQTKWKQVADRLARPRNQAVHGGISPSRNTAEAAINEAKSLLDAYSPLPQP